MKSIYLDYAAATPLEPKVLAAMEPYFTAAFYNPSAPYLAAKTVNSDIEVARQRVAVVLGARSTEIIFTAGATEANNLALQGTMLQFPDKRLLVSSIEHESILAATQDYNNAVLPVLADGRLDLVAAKKQISDDVVLLSLIYANNEIGTIQPMRQLSSIVREVRVQRRRDGNLLPLWLHSDATQAANYLDLHVARLGVDMLTLNGGKIYGPKQTGVLFLRHGVELRPTIAGGGQESGLRSGTENVPGIIGFAAALQLVQGDRLSETHRLQALQDLFVSLLTSAIPGVKINGSLAHRLPNNVHVTIPGQDNERLIMALDEAGIMAAAGSACHASSAEPSHVLRAIGLTDTEARSSIRFTMGRQSTEKDIRHTVEVLHRLIA